MASRKQVGCLWPAEFEDTPAGAYRFLLAQRTWNEADGIDGDPFPDKEFLRLYAYEWHTCFKAGRTLITEKCRRMVISWAARGLELFQMGLRRTDCILGGEDLEAAAKHVWRLQYLYEGMQKHYPDWRLPGYVHLSYQGERKLKMFGLANGSVCNYANGQAEGLQGDGVKIITLEELGIYRRAGSMLAQAQILTQGSATSAGGFVNAITNASPLHAWQQIKKGANGED